ncbi:TonB-dependent receptor plug domain-containing protein [Flavobacterium sp.]|uniref:TonB-dependent receptor n=1 Tax=Flavobacterium sp. TaxID=239 RepID=UPI0022C40607|nr:TonB-dependent receptor plug domain-containing protein [Flavobacterium sp.]MCZ8228203.1 TonB-dependent receptor [Flavobacterium sp.]
MFPIINNIKSNTTIFYLILVFCSLTIYGQKSTTGVIIDQTSTPIVDTTIEIIELNIATKTDEDGKFSIALPSGEWTLKISHFGYENHSYKINTNSKQNIQIQLKKRTNQLAEVAIKGKTAAKRQKETGFTIEIINTKELQNLTLDANQVLKTKSGINIRESGGLGSGFNLSLNGLSGNQIRYFMDGVPMENYGSSLTLNNYPILLLESIEVYKGVVPINFGGDALAGVINMKTENKKESFLDASYSYGSFNTSRFALSSKYYNKENQYYFKLNSFYNYSDNNFKTDNVPVFDALGNITGTASVKRFHDQYKSAMLSGEFGLVDKSFADILSFKLTYAQNKKNLQHPEFNILRPFGAFNTRNNTYLFSANYKKAFQKLRINANLVGGRVQEIIDDTSDKRYNWLNEVIETRDPDDFKGELFERRSLFTLQDILFNSQVYIKYPFNKNHDLSVNLVHNYLKRKGNDAVDELNRAFKTPSTLQKYITSIAYTFKDNNEKIDFSAFAKRYQLLASISLNDPLDNVDAIILSEPNYSKIGYGASLALHPFRFLTTKLSYEKAYRLPESYEILGNGVSQSPNIRLKPETSDNFNIGVIIQKNISNVELEYESNIFLRKSTDFIRFSPQGPFGNYENLQDVLSRGIENSISIDYKKIAKLSTNVTYQNITEENQFNEGVLNSNYKGKVANIPTFFMNINLSVKPFYKKFDNRCTLYWSTYFGDDFYLAEENGGASGEKNTIPSQLTHRFDLEYIFKNKKFSISGSVTNLADAKVYDNFRIQNPGRAAYIKLRYSIK